jgi:rare lipoprotein A
VIRTLALLAALLCLGGCGSAPVKPGTPPASGGSSRSPAATPGAAPDPNAYPARVTGSRPDRPGEYTAGGLYKPGVADGGPAIPPDVSRLQEPTPKAEPRARYGNRSPYTVLGKVYHVMDSAAGYVERGTASWYGNKFHGRATSSLEPYDMYQFTAAHKTLPLPTYARVTNLDNGRSVTVRVNDRGPFHAGRIIDLSYAAAIKLGIHVQGTGRVEVRALAAGEVPPPVSASAPAPAAGRGSPVQRAVAGDSGRIWLQVASFGERANAKRLEDRLQDADIRHVDVKRGKARGERVYRVRIGPFDSRVEAQRVMTRVRGLGLGNPVLVDE